MNRILLVDDEEGIREIFTRLHETMDETFRGQCEMDTAINLSGAIKRLESIEYDAIILDLTMPPHGARDTIAWLKLAHKKLPPVVVLTGTEDVSIRRCCMMAGAANFFTKADAMAFPNLFFKILYNEYLRRIYDTESAGTQL